jgi:DNA-binding transcriptional LysR family regulator
LGDLKAQLVSLQQIRCVLATVRAGSFTGAAELLDVSQPAVAEQIRNLERLLGIELFVRAGRGVRLTAAGTAFAESAPAVLGALDDAVDSVDAVRALRTGILAFGLFATPEAYAVDRVASAFARSHPGISLRLVGQNSSVAADRVREGELEAALVVLPIDDDGLDVRPFVRDEVVYVSSDPRHTREQVTIERLTRRPLILYEAESGDRDPLRRQLKERAQELGLELSARVETETMVMALQLVADGVGDTYVPRAHTAMPYFPRGLTTTTFRPVVHETFAIVTRRGTRPSPATAAFIADLKVHMTTLDPRLEAISAGEGSWIQDGEERSSSSHV